MQLIYLLLAQRQLNKRSNCIHRQQRAIAFYLFIQKIKQVAPKNIVEIQKSCQYHRYCLLRCLQIQLLPYEKNVGFQNQLMISTDLLASSVPISTTEICPASCATHAPRLVLSKKGHQAVLYNYPVRKQVLDKQDCFYDWD